MTTANERAITSFPLFCSVLFVFVSFFCDLRDTRPHGGRRSQYANNPTGEAAMLLHHRRQYWASAFDQDDNVERDAVSAAHHFLGETTVGKIRGGWVKKAKWFAYRPGRRSDLEGPERARRHGEVSKNVGGDTTCRLQKHPNEEVFGHQHQVRDVSFSFDLGTRAENRAWRHTCAISEALERRGAAILATRNAGRGFRVHTYSTARQELKEFVRKEHGWE